MIDQALFDRLLPFAYEWAKAQEDYVLAHGMALSPQQMADARLAGVQDCERVRVLVVDRIPLPEDPELAEAARRTHIITEDARGIGLGHAIIVRAQAWGDRELLVHNLVHIAQCERSGGLEPWVRQYLVDRQNSASFSICSLEEEALRIAREICATEAAG